MITFITVVTPLLELILRIISFLFTMTGHQTFWLVACESTVYNGREGTAELTAMGAQGGHSLYLGPQGIREID